MDDLLELNKSRFIEREREKGSSSRSYFQAVKCLSSASAPAQWDVMDLFPGKAVGEAAEEIGDYFTRISNLFEPLREGEGRATARERVTEQQVVSVLKKCKKPASSVKGDVMPRLMKRFHHLFVKPTTIIFNKVFETASWPRNWKVETTVIIPKNSNPSSLSETRNISCTSFLSKAMEAVLLEDIRMEVAPDPIQYGGLKGCSTNHLLVDLINSILRPLEEGNPVVVTGVDFEKAFNRLDHHECLRQLTKLGASPASVSMIRAFLTGRSMRIKLGGELSRERPLSGGSPQGGILGCLLYCLATQQLNAQLPRNNQTRGPLPQVAPPLDEPRSPDDEELPGMGIQQWHAGLPRSPPRTPETQETLGQPTPEEVDGNGGSICMVKYIDDATTVEVVERDNAIRHITGNAPTELVPAVATEGVTAALIDAGKAMGVKVNCSKTQAICVGADNGYLTTAVLKVGDDTITSGAALKILGYVVGSKPGAHDQVENIKRKFRGKFWSLIHLRRAGMKGDELFAMYGVFVRSVIEANSVVYGPMLNGYQKEEIERLQKQVIKLCYGFNEHYGTITERRNIYTLEARRKKALENFTRKVIKDDRFRTKWLKPREEIGTNLRNRRPYIEDKAKTSRFLYSPLLAIQKCANDICTNSA